MNKQEESEYTQQEFEVLDKILSAFIHKKERVFVIKEVFKEGYRKRSQELVSDCIHDWYWSNNAGRYFCNKCNEWSYLGNHSNAQVATDAVPSLPALRPLDETFKRMKYILHTKETITGSKPNDKIRLEMIEHIIDDVCSKFGTNVGGVK